VLPHTHLPLKSFPKSIPKNKVIFVDRDPRAVACSAYHFFCELKDSEDTVFVGPYVDLFNVKDINQFADLFLSGNFFYGDYFEYNEEWKKDFKKTHPEADILYVSFEWLKSNLVNAVQVIADFLNISDCDYVEVAEKSSFKSAAKKQVKKVRETDFNASKLYRSGKLNGWRHELDEAVWQKYSKRAQLFGYSFNEFV